jgi:hypothetical protein
MYLLFTVFSLIVGIFKPFKISIKQIDFSKKLGSNCLDKGHKNTPAKRVPEIHLTSNFGNV